MSFKSSLYQFLIADSGVSSLVGVNVYPLVIPSQDYDEATKRPCLVYVVDENEKSKTFCGTISLKRKRVSLACYAKTSAEAEALKEAVNAALEDFSGDMKGTYVDNVDQDNEFDVLDLEPGLFREQLVYSIWHT